jgi:hypothetical protein
MNNDSRKPAAGKSHQTRTGAPGFIAIGSGPGMESSSVHTQEMGGAAQHATGRNTGSASPDSFSGAKENRLGVWIAANKDLRFGDLIQPGDLLQLAPLEGIELQRCHYLVQWPNGRRRVVFVNHLTRSGTHLYVDVWLGTLRGQFIDLRSSGVHAWQITGHLSRRPPGEPPAWAPNCAALCRGEAI